jgi:hypothetical protein
MRNNIDRNQAIVHFYFKAYTGYIGSLNHYKITKMAQKDSKTDSFIVHTANLSDFINLGGQLHNEEYL